MAVQALWFLLTQALAFSYTALLPPLVVATSSDSGKAAPPPAVGAPSPGCPRRCGTVNIPYPFGIGVECAWPGTGSDNLDFTITCNHSFNPPRPYTGDFEIISISLEAGEMRVYSPVSYICYNSSKTTESDGFSSWSLYFVATTFLISPTRNVFTVIGCDTLALFDGREDGSYFSGCVTSCVSLHQSAQDGEECTGLGCCQTSVPTNLTTVDISWGNNNSYTPTNQAWRYSPCNFAYHFKRRDLTRLANKTFTDRVGNNKTVPMVLDWAIRDGGSCQALPNDYGGASGKATAPACISRNSFCVNATQGHGYLCNCSQGYTGNPCITDGCTNINECELQKSNPRVYKKLYPCGSGSKCHDMPGDYECKCKFGYRGDGKSEKGCQPIFPGYAIAIVATFVAVVLAFLAFILFIRRKQRKLFNKNGGKILKGQGITIYTKKELKKITKNYKQRLGGGYFSDVYEGTIPSAKQDQRVAVKCSVTTRAAHFQQKVIRHEVPQREEEEDGFINEITFQFSIRHTNVVQLLGCCLETDIPILVFEFVSEGSLDDVLHGGAKHIPGPLSFMKRLDIAIGSAEALSHIHSHGDYNHVHGDVKSANILLDSDLKPKVADFGSSRILSVDRWATAVPADMRYIDPVYYSTQKFTVKSDVYSFGLVLLELITRKKVLYEGNKSLPLEFMKCYKDESSRRTMYDMDMFSGEDAQFQCHFECLDRIGALAVRCLNKEDVEERPTMAEVVEDLKQVKLIAFGNTSSDTS
ncbi:unnamed protein product [Urochloa decumbens]|uniref:Uncharacterized protein n=1 Tax=Urochloa decumbens TaxID=240449 RepID=A0ABC9ARZ7_9POAL